MNQAGRVVLGIPDSIQKTTGLARFQTLVQLSWAS
jgi:hypothetical protein